MSLHLRLHVVSAKKNQSTVLNSDLESFKTSQKFCYFCWFIQGVGMMIAFGELYQDSVLKFKETVNRTRA